MQKLSQLHLTPLHSCCGCCCQVILGDQSGAVEPPQRWKSLLSVVDRAVNL